MNKIIFAFSTLFLLVSCKPEIKPINYGTDECDYCRMTIVDNQYASELVNSNGKTFVFDATECMLNYLEQSTKNDFPLILVTDYNQPGQLIKAQKAFFIRSKELPSPMGMYITAIRSKEEANSLKNHFGGELYDFPTLQKEFPTMNPL